MQIIKPETVTNAYLTSNVAITETLWTAGTYTIGQQRYYQPSGAVFPYLYEVTVASTTDRPDLGAALTPTPSWKNIGAINKWKMFDGKANAQTTKATPLDVTVQMPYVINSLSVLNVEAATLQVTVTDSIEGQVYNRQMSLLDNSAVTDWYTFFFLPYTQLFDVVLNDLPAYSNAAIRLQLTSASGDVKCGEFALGNIRTVGETSFGSSVGILDFSKKQADEQGNFYIEQRTYSKRGTFDVTIDTSAVDTTHRFMTSLRAVPCVFVGSENFGSTIIYGFFRDFDIIISNPALSTLSMSIEGL
jgi:hypothetical protein